MPSTISCSSRIFHSGCRCQAAPRHLVQRQHGVVARVVGVVAGRPVDDLAALAQREVVGDRDRLVVGHQEAVLGLRGRRPGAHARAGARPRQVDRGVAAEIVPVAVRRHVLLVRAPAELGRLQAFRAEALDRPGVDEHAARLRLARALGVALGDVDALDADALHQPRPLLAGLRLGRTSTPVSRAMSSSACLTIQDTMPGLAPQQLTAVDPAGPAAAHVEHALAQRIVRALRDRGLGVGVEAGPRLADRVDVVGVDVLAEVHQVGRGGVDRQVDDHAAAGPAGEQRGQHLPVVVPGDRELARSAARARRAARGRCRPGR